MTPSDITIRARLIDELSRPLQAVRDDLKAAGRSAREEFGAGMREGARQADAAGDAAGRAAPKVRRVDDALAATGGRARTFDGLLRGATAGLDRLKGAAVFAGKALAGVLAGGVALAVAKGPQLLSFLSEAESANKRFAAAFGDSAQLNAWVDAQHETFGTARADIRGLLADVGVLGKAGGLSGAALDSWSQQLLTDARDLAAAHGKTVDEVQGMMKSALVGEYDPIQNLGVLINAKMVEEAAKKYGYYADGVLSQQEQMLAVQRLVNEQVGAQGARGAALANLEGFDAQLERVRGLIRDLVESEGGAVRELATSVLKSVGDWIQGGGVERAIESLRGAFDVLKSGLGWVRDNGEAIKVVLVALVAAIGAFKVLQTVNSLLTAFNLVLAANPVMLVVVAIAALVAGLVYFFTQTETGRAAWEAFTSALGTAWQWVVDKVSAGVGWVQTKWGEMQAAAAALAVQIGQRVDAIVGFFTGLPDRIKAGLVSFAGMIWEQIAVPAIRVVNGLIEAMNRLPGVALSTISTVNPLLDASQGVQVAPGARRYNPGMGPNDTRTSKARGGGIGNTMAALYLLGGAAGQGLGISNVWVGGGGRGYGSGDHQAGRALDLVGPSSTLARMAHLTRSVGGFAEMHGQHLHWVPPVLPEAAPTPRRSLTRALASGGMGDTLTPARVATLAGGVTIAPGAVQVVVNGAGDIDEARIAVAVENALRRVARDAYERS